MSKRLFDKLRGKYAFVDDYIEGGLRPVSTIDPTSIELAYHHDWMDKPGNWGYVDKNGVEVIKPQYIFAGYFRDGVATICKGKWTKSKKWDNECNQGHYWMGKENWGLIDKSGKYIIPCVYDDPISEITDDYPIIKMPLLYSAHKFDASKEVWRAAIFDKKGNKVLDFGKYYRIDYCSVDGQIVVTVNGWLYEEGTICAVFDLNKMKEIIAPKYPYIEVVAKNAFLVGDDYENGFNSTLIDETEKPISDLKFDYISEDLNDKHIFEGRLSGEKSKIKFKIVDGNLKIIKTLEKEIKK